MSGTCSSAIHRQLRKSDEGLIIVVSKGPETVREPLRREITIVNPQGLHMRPAAAFAEKAGSFESSVIVFRDVSQPVDGKNWLELLLLAGGQSCL